LQKSIVLASVPVLVLAFIVCGAMIRILSDVRASIFSIGNSHYLPLANMPAFTRYAEETFTQIIPFALHFAFVLMEKVGTMKSVTRRVLYVMLLNVHVVAVGSLLESASAEAENDTFLVLLLRSFALLAALDICCIVAKCLPLTISNTNINMQSEVIKA